MLSHRPRSHGWSVTKQCYRSRQSTFSPDLFTFHHSISLGSLSRAIILVIFVPDFGNHLSVKGIDFFLDILCVHNPRKHWEEAWAAPPSPSNLPDEREKWCSQWHCSGPKPRNYCLFQRTHPGIFAPCYGIWTLQVFPNPKNKGEGNPTEVILEGRDIDTE